VGGGAGGGGRASWQNSSNWSQLLQWVAEPGAVAATPNVRYVTNIQEIAVGGGAGGGGRAVPREIVLLAPLLQWVAEPGGGGPNWDKLQFRHDRPDGGVKRNATPPPGGG